MELSIQLSCPCRPGFAYKSRESLYQHKKTKQHKTWEAAQDQKQDKARAKDFENQIERLRRKIDHKEAIETALLTRIRQLEDDILYWKAACEDVYVN
jgi:hypothetical protein